MDLSTFGCHSQSSAPSTGDDNLLSINWPSTPAPSDRGDKSDEDDNDNDEDSTARSSPSLPPSPPQPLATPTPKAKIEPPTSIPHTNKCKAIADEVQEITDMDHSQHMKIAEIKEQEKTNQSQAKYQSKHALEMARIQFQCHEAEAARQHQLQYLRSRLNLSISGFRGMDMDSDMLILAMWFLPLLLVLPLVVCLTLALPLLA